MTDLYKALLNIYKSPRDFRVNITTADGRQYNRVRLAEVGYISVLLENTNLDVILIEDIDEITYLSGRTYWKRA